MLSSQGAEARGPRLRPIILTEGIIGGRVKAGDIHGVTIEQLNNKPCVVVKGFQGKRLTKDELYIIQVLT